ncbi:MAG: 30S ribosomal protein S3 [Candidatus Coatesbacteria bacterium RBG_13_66_14]|uniref:Small ribosomal subunit protein uS3 n=1 Tax=Candidatus Coatesbacteria bacterium RBG_13_66_14 TaxID=1817816 RepID=A0A1F5F3B9_9BACT|nr:ribosomal protein S3 [uncultured bacterium]OGD74102.1 MAG: 30S ribosomal protein S3 [Candidatus Coatesbacteria bacterium RBG_13_66_14]
MGQKTHPIGFRLGFSKPWESRWFARGREYRKQLHEDIIMRVKLKQKLFAAGVSSIEFERLPNLVTVIVRCSRPGIIIGRKGSEVNKLRDDIAAELGKPVKVLIDEVRDPEINALLVAENVASQLEKRIGFRRAMKKVLESALRRGAEGIKIICSGRLGGAEMSRTERYIAGRVPLHTLRADIDYGFTEAATTAGKIGVKVWIFRGERLPDSDTLSGEPVNAPSGMHGERDDARRPRRRPPRDNKDDARGSDRPRGGAKKE